MSRRFKSAKPLGKNRKNTKTESAESRAQSLPEHASVKREDRESVLDFLFVDRPRISALYAQLFTQGTIATVKTTEQQMSSSDRTFGGNVQVLKGEFKSTNAATEGIERMFDASWAVPTDVLWNMMDRGLVKYGFDGTAHLGSIILLPGFIRLIDYAGLKDIWEPAMNSFVHGENAEAIRAGVAMVKNLPHAVHAHFLTRVGTMWASLSPEHLLLPPADITLKHGGHAMGAWRMLFIVDAFADLEEKPPQDTWSAGGATDGVVAMMHALRSQIGRPVGWHGVTPLIIYRPISGRVQV